MEEQNSIDKLRLLHSLPIILGDNLCLVYPVTLSEIAQLGEEKFFHMLNLLTITTEDINAETAMSPFDFLLVNSVNSDFFLELQNAFSTFIREEITILPRERAIRIGDKLMYEKDFIQLQKILSLQNNLEEDKDSMSNPADAEAARIIAKIKEGKEKIGKNEMKVELSDLVSCLAAKGNGINIFNVWELSYYSFNDMFKRLKMIEDYDVNMRSILAGADPKKVQLKHWIRNINEK